MPHAPEPGCYCSLWDTHPEVLRSQGVPEGFCGMCDVCGRPGHTRHHPGAVPYTGAWCASHYRRLRWTHPATTRGAVLWLVGIALLVWALDVLATGT